jgi:hypothetical protein
MMSLIGVVVGVIAVERMYLFGGCCGEDGFDVFDMRVGDVAVAVERTDFICSIKYVFHDNNIRRVRIAGALLFFGEDGVDLSLIGVIGVERMYLFGCWCGEDGFGVNDWRIINM